MTTPNPSAEYFAGVAGEWDTLRSGYFTEAVRTSAIQKAYLRPEMTVADIGGGTGFMAAGLAPRVARVHLLDGSPEMLEQARRNLAGHANIEVHLAESRALPLPDESVDAAFANMYLHHCPDPLAALREMVRILKPGGRLVITDMDAHPYAWFKDEMADVWQGFERRQVRAWLAEAGLVNGLVDCSGESCCAKSNNDAVAADQREVTINVFVATGTKRIAMREQVQGAYSARAQQGCGCGGSASAEQSYSSGADAAAGQSCCSSENAIEQSGLFAHDYSSAERASVPDEAGQFSLGCGNPVALAGLKEGETVLDIGSGGGLDALLAAQRVGPTGHVIGVDMTPAMLERARRAAEKGGFSNVSFREGQAEKLPVAGRSVDVVISNCVVNLCEDKAVVFDEIFRVLKPGGRIEISDMVTSGPLPLDARLSAGDWAACLSGALPEQEYRDLLAQAGFREIRVRRSVTEAETDGASIYSAGFSALRPARSSCCG